MSRLIDADAIPYTMVYKENWMSGTGGEEPMVWKSDIDKMPTVEPERKTGMWFADNNNYITPHFVCSACGMSQKVETIMYKPIWAFCPRCGARMMEVEHENDRR